MPILIGSALPAGTAVSFAGSSAPSGWLLCDGSSLLVADYADLFSAIGYDYGGATTNFNLPDLRARTPIGVNNVGLPNGENGSFSTRDAADAGGTETDGTTSAGGHTHTVDSHSRTIGSDGNHNHTGTTGDAINIGGGTGQDFAPIGNTHDHAISSQAAHDHTGATQTFAPGTNNPGNHAHTADIMQPFVTLNYIIKT